MNQSNFPAEFLWGITGLYCLVIIGVLAVILTALCRVQVGHSLSLREIFRQTRFLELTTVLVIIISGTYLALSEKLTEGVISLLSGIAGYVLGGLATNKREQEATSASSSKPQSETQNNQPSTSQSPNKPN